jgi:CRISPR/Cas system CSM-associated protein Csm3 (group 7 of RAMP superfamily)
MSRFRLIATFPGGGPLIGGAASSPPGIHASHAQLPDGTPYLPATALRGALRETLEAVLRGSGEHRACSGGDGVDPDAGAEDGGVVLAGAAPPGSGAASASSGATPAGGAAVSCTLGADGAPCLACRLFGTRRARIGDAERAFSGLVLGDACAAGATTWAARPSVAVDRRQRSAADHHLRFQRIPQAGEGGTLAFTAEGWLSDPSLRPYLEAAVRATTHVGAGRSRGLAHVELALAGTVSEAPAPAVPADGDLQLRVELTSPALVATATVDANYRETRHDIPGSTVRGAVGFALRALVAQLDDDRAAQALLDPEHGARFGFLYHVDPAAPRGDGGPSGPLPITAAACKREGLAHGVVDLLLDRLALRHATSAEQAEQATRGAATQCRQCQEPLRAVHGSRRAGGDPATRSVVRVAMDRARQSARDGQLFGQELLAPGVVLEGTIRDIPAEGRARLAQALGSGILSFGRGRSAGWGQAKITVERAPSLPPLAKRAAAFDAALRDRLARARLPADRIGRLVPVTLLSPLWPAGGDDDDGARELCAAVGAASCWLAARRFSREGAWNQRTGELTAFQATSAGGVFVLELHQATWRDLVARLEDLERRGAGQRRDQGFGHLLCFDPHFLIAPKNG